MNSQKELATINLIAQGNAGTVRGISLPQAINAKISKKLSDVRKTQEIQEMSKNFPEIVHNMFGEFPRTSIELVTGSQPDSFGENSYRKSYPKLRRQSKDRYL